MLGWGCVALPVLPTAPILQGGAGGSASSPAILCSKLLAVPGVSDLAMQQVNLLGPDFSLFFFFPLQAVYIQYHHLKVI